MHYQETIDCTDNVWILKLLIISISWHCSSSIGFWKTLSWNFNQKLLHIDQLLSAHLTLSGPAYFEQNLQVGKSIIPRG
jgi:hypothetical protein